MSTRNEKDKTKMSAKDLKVKLADIEDENKMLKVKIEKLAQDVIKKNRKIKRQHKTINQLNARVSNYKTSTSTIINEESIRVDDLPLVDELDDKEMSNSVISNIQNKSLEPSTQDMSGLDDLPLTDELEDTKKVRFNRSRYGKYTHRNFNSRYVRAGRSAFRR